MSDLIRTFAERGDLAHLALLLWALSASALTWFALRELTAASRRFDDFVRELARFNENIRRALMKTIDFARRLNWLESRSGYNHLDTFCEFLDHLGRIPRLRGDETAPDETRGTNL
jgi:hypothetical protein